MVDFCQSYFESYCQTQNEHIVAASAVAFIFTFLLAGSVIHIGCFLLGLIIIELIILGFGFRCWSLLSRLLIILFSLLGFILGRWMLSKSITECQYDR